MGSATTVKVSRFTLQELKKLRDEIGAPSLEVAIRALIKKHRRDLVGEAFGADQGKVSHFTEADRGDER